MKQIFKCFYLHQDDYDVWCSCLFLNENKHKNHKFKINSYIVYVLTGDIYLPDVIQQHFNIISQAEQNPGEVYGAGGQNFSLDISAKEVVFYHNMFEEDEGWPVLSCSLPMFKSVLTAWHLFLQLPKGIHTKLEVEIPYQP